MVEGRGGGACVGSAHSAPRQFKTESVLNANGGPTAGYGSANTAGNSLCVCVGGGGAMLCFFFMPPALPSQAACMATQEHASLLLCDAIRRRAVSEVVERLHAHPQASACRPGDDGLLFYVVRTGDSDAHAARAHFSATLTIVE